MSVFIDFRELRRQLSIEDVLNLYQVKLKVSGNRATGFCPLPTHPKREKGKRTASFSVDLARGLFNCFGCRMGGSVLDLAIRLEGKNPDNSADVRAVALKLVEEFGIETKPTESSDTRAVDADRTAMRHNGKENPQKHRDKTNAIINAPLEFTLKLDPEHPYLLDRGFTPETIRHFGLGFCFRGMLKDRIAIPLHNASSGQLVGYAGRLVDDDLIDDEHPKYLFPGSHERGGKIHEFHKNELLYNIHRLPSDLSELIIVEGFASVWWLHQHGYHHAVAVMGSSMSDHQAKIIQSIIAECSRIFILTDDDAAGDLLANGLLQKLAPAYWCHWVKLRHGKQPTDLNGEELAQALT